MQEPKRKKLRVSRVLLAMGAIVVTLFGADGLRRSLASQQPYNLTINGNKGASGTGVVNTFDGLDKLLTGAETEITSEVDVSTSAKMDTDYNALLDEVDAFLSTLDGKPSMLLMNEKMLTKMRGASRRAGYYARSRDEFGRTVETYNDIPMYDMGKYYNGSATVDIIPVDATGKTDIYAVSIGLDGFHGISPTGSKVISSYMPDLNAPGAVKDGEVELVAGVVLKNTNKAGVLRGIKVGSASASL